MRSTIRTVPLALLLGLAFIFGASLLASGPAHGADEEADEAVEASDVKAMQEQIAALQKQVQYLRSREAGLSAYVLANDTRAVALGRALAQSKAQGFLNRSIPLDSREALLGGLLDLARSMRAELPAMTSEQARMRKQADAATRKAGSAD